MNHKDARANFTPTVIPGLGDAANVVPITRAPLSGEHEYIRQQIRSKERQIAQLANEIRWLKLELESA